MLFPGLLTASPALAANGVSFSTPGNGASLSSPVHMEMAVQGMKIRPAGEPWLRHDKVRLSQCVCPRCTMSYQRSHTHTALPLPLPLPLPLLLTLPLSLTLTLTLPLLPRAFFS